MTLDAVGKLTGLNVPIWPEIGFFFTPGESPGDNHKLTGMTSHGGEIIGADREISGMRFPFEVPSVVLGIIKKEMTGAFEREIDGESQCQSRGGEEDR